MSEERSKILEVLDRAITSGTWNISHSFPYNFRKPGEIIQRMNDEARALLQKLKSSDLVNNLRSEFYAIGFDWQSYYNRGFKEGQEAKLSFDKKILKR